MSKRAMYALIPLAIAGSALAVEGVGTPLAAGKETPRTACSTAGWNTAGDRVLQALSIFYKGDGHPVHLGLFGGSAVSVQVSLSNGTSFRLAFPDHSITRKFAVTGSALGPSCRGKIWITYPRAGGTTAPPTTQAPVPSTTTPPTTTPPPPVTTSPSSGSGATS